MWKRIGATATATALALTGLAAAQEQGAATRPADRGARTPTAQEGGLRLAPESGKGGEQLGTMTIHGEPIFHNRTDDVNPVLNFGQEYFQRFEPTSAGEMLKRLPGVSFTNDVGEFQDPKLRGLPSGYTQILLNGERLPGAPNNRSPLVDRIPFELIERVEIVRSPSAEIDSQGPAGTLNIVTKSPAEFDGVSLTLGGTYASALEDKSEDTDSDGFGQASLIYGDTVGPVDFLFNASFTQRYNPKLQDTTVFERGASGPGPGNFGLVEFESQADTRETDDVALNWRSTIEPEGTRTKIDLDAFVVLTDRVETEETTLFESGFGGFSPPFGGAFFDDEVNVDVDELQDEAQPLERESQQEDIEQEQYGVAIGLERPVSDRLEFDGQVSFRNFDEDREETGRTREFDAAGNQVASETEGESLDIDNPSYSGKLDFDYELAEDQELGYGVQGRLQERDTVFQVSEGGTLVTDQSFEINEDVFAGYVEHEWEITDELTMQHGLRLEYTDLRTSGAGEGTRDDEYIDPNPSVAYRYDLTERDRFHLSAARTLRRPDFNELEPFVIPEEPGDNSAITGDPTLEPERSWGVDLGYQRTFAGGEGIAGINFFYRDISDVIELSGTGDSVSVGGSSFDEFQYRNAGDGELYGMEIDFSSPLGFVGLPQTALFTNGTLLESEVEDTVTGEDREFTRTPNWVVNAGIQQELPANFRLGASVHAEGDIRDDEVTEITIQEQDPFVQAFIEKSWPEHNATLRFVAKNLLDRAKIENKREFDSIGQRRNNNPPVRELENEQRGRVFKLVLRMRF